MSGLVTVIADPAVPATDAKFARLAVCAFTALDTEPEKKLAVKLVTVKFAIDNGEDTDDAVAA